MRLLSSQKYFKSTLHNLYQSDRKKFIQQQQPLSRASQISEKNSNFLGVKISPKSPILTTIQGSTSPGFDP